ncbi:winged helix-turn-helix transcriptional regulator [Candidatus Woesearchaeota archaeon]|nr:winged helix-turn-helix transcriptional regulator [Candidatus Woesearchaeota archaeon]
MKNKRLGIILLVIGIIIAIILINLTNKYNRASTEEGCFPNDECKSIESSLSMTHFAFGIIGFILALGFYLIFFSKSEEILLKRLEDIKQDKITEDKFSILTKALDPFEQKVLKAVKEQEGITQNTLRIRTDLSKAKVSYVVNDLERKGLIKRDKKGKTFAIFLREAI